MPQRHEYQVPGDDYYYFRPYNYTMIAAQQQQVRQWGLDPHHPSDNRVFDEITRKQEENGPGQPGILPASQPIENSAAQLPTGELTRPSVRPAMFVAAVDDHQPVAALQDRIEPLQPVAEPPSLVRLASAGLESPDSKPVVQPPREPASLAPHSTLLVVKATSPIPFAANAYRRSLDGEKLPQCRR
jgi:hypothetical protein